MDSTTDQPKPARAQLAKFMKWLFITCWAALVAGFVAVVAAGHMSPPALVALAGAMAALAGILFILFRGLQKWTHDGDYKLVGKALGLIFVFAGVSLLLAALTVYLQ